MPGRVIILTHCTPPHRDLSIYEVSSWYLKYFLRYALDKNVGRKEGRTGGDYFYIPRRLSCLLAWDKKIEMKITNCLTLFLWNEVLFIANLTPWDKGLGCDTSFWCGIHLCQVILKSSNAWQCYSLETNVTFKLFLWP
jgi:hypothetical protein